VARGLAGESQAGVPLVLPGGIRPEEEDAQAAESLSKTGDPATGDGKERMLEHGFYVG